MPFLFIVIGVTMVVAAARDTVSDYKDGNGNKQPGLATLIVGDFTRQDNFIYWMIAMLLIGAIGYIKPLQPVSRGFMALVVVTLLLKNKGVFDQFNTAIAGTAGGPGTTGNNPFGLGGQSGGAGAGDKTQGW